MHDRYTLWGEDGESEDTEYLPTTYPFDIYEDKENYGGEQTESQTESNSIISYEKCRYGHRVDKFGGKCVHYHGPNHNLYPDCNKCSAGGMWKKNGY